MGGEDQPGKRRTTSEVGGEHILRSMRTTTGEVGEGGGGVLGQTTPPGGGGVVGYVR